jgi:hypothetical protein
MLTSLVITAGTWPNKKATWRVASYSPDLPSDIQLAQFVNAFAAWDAVSVLQLFPFCGHTIPTK